MRQLYGKYDDDLQKNEFLKRHCECLPFIGDEYEKSRLLLVGESHYIEEDKIGFVNRDDFYDVSICEIEDGEYKTWFDTRAVFEYRREKPERFESFFSNISNEIAKIAFKTDSPSTDQKRKAMDFYAFMNYFKRPSYDRGKTISGLTESDYEYAYKVSKHIIYTLKPNLIIFLSKKAYDRFCCADKDNMIRNKYDIKSVSHPSSYWWNRKRKDGKCAREDFYDYISNYFRLIYDWVAN